MVELRKRSNRREVGVGRIYANGFFQEETEPFFAVSCVVNGTYYCDR
jgi:hypothetical protein